MKRKTTPRLGSKKAANAAPNPGRNVDTLIEAAIAVHRPAETLADHASAASLTIHDQGSEAAAHQSSHKSTAAKRRKRDKPAINSPAHPPLVHDETVSEAPPGGAHERRTAGPVSKPPVPEDQAGTAQLKGSIANRVRQSAAQAGEPVKEGDRRGSSAEDTAVRAHRPPVADAAAEQPVASAQAASEDAQVEGEDTADAEVLARSIGQFIEFSGKATAAYLKPREIGEVSAASNNGEVIGTLNSLGRIAESWMANPARMIQAQAALSTQLFSLWTDSLSRSVGKPQTEPSTPRVTDKRFASPEWQSAPIFDFLHRAYLATTDWAKMMVDDAEGIDSATRDKAAFYLRQISSALSPSNFLLTNPELLKETFAAKGENLVRGMQMLAEDIAAGKGELKIRQSDTTKFKLGVDMASSPGKVIFRNELMELLQYAPSTPDVLKRPLLIVPPWINKFYVLDLNSEKSFIRWAVAQGLTVFVISWVNPDERHAAKDWDAYMREGIFAALDAIEQAIGEKEVSTVGYCVGGTLLAATLAYMAAKGDWRVTSTTFLTTQVDFEEAGDLKVFADEAQIKVVEQQMEETGYLAGSRMANAFNMLRPDDLIWNYAVNTYVRGKAPSAFDLLAWNADATRMSAANHAFYLRNCYLENNLTKGEMVIGGEKLNLRLVTIPVYDLAAREDHIAPARSVFTGSKHFGGTVRYVLAGSGHIAGVVNPPSRAKYQYWANGRTDGSFEEWLSTASETKGTWWLDWIDWVKTQAPDTVPARDPSQGGLAPLGDAPGEYVRVQS